MADAIIFAIGEIGEAASYVAGLILGRKFRLDPKHAQRIGEMIILVLVAGVLIALTVTNFCVCNVTDDAGETKAPGGFQDQVSDRTGEKVSIYS